jgi:hypothetical protein
MWIRLRQIAVVVAELDPVVDVWSTVLGIEVCYRDPQVGQFGLCNALMPVGNQLIELVSPLRAGTAGGRFLDRRGGDGGYMVIAQVEDFAPFAQRVEELGVRLVHAFEVPGEIRDMQLHPRDTGGALFEIDEIQGPGAHDPDGPWRYAGPDWQRARRLERVSAVTAAEIQCDDDPGRVAARWGALTDRPPMPDHHGRPTLQWDNATVRFVRSTDGRPEGLGAIDVRTVDRPAVLAAAAAHGVPHRDGLLTLGGLRVNLVG